LFVVRNMYVDNAILNQVKAANTTLIVIAIGDNYVVKLINIKSDKRYH